MEFEGNESWGYNTSFHTALDKFYGTENKLKVCRFMPSKSRCSNSRCALNHAFLEEILWFVCG
jgi:hypothetical protein